MTTVSSSSVIRKQPHLVVSWVFPASHDTPELRTKYKLSVFRMYDLPNEFGGVGVFKRCDHDGRLFNTEDELKTFCLEHGYTSVYFTASSLRQRKVDEGYNPHTGMYEGPNPPQWWIKRGRPVIKHSF